MLYNLQGKIVNFKETKIMGILNLSAESFYNQQVSSSIDSLLNLADKHVRDGADILDLGAVSSKPFAPKIDEAEEWKRLKEPLQQLQLAFPNAIFSIDTSRSSIAEKTLSAGVQIINDISLLSDRKMSAVISRYQCAYILMHTQGTPETMQLNPNYKQVTADIIKGLSNQIKKLKEVGFDQVIIDPGFGFGKSIDHNYQILRGMKSFGFLNVPLLAGLSRKSMLYKLLKTTPEEALNASTAAHMLCLLNGANVLRVHDVKQAKETIEIYNKYLDN